MKAATSLYIYTLIAFFFHLFIYCFFFNFQILLTTNQTNVLGTLVWGIFFIHTRTLNIYEFARGTYPSTMLKIPKPSNTWNHVIYFQAKSSKYAPPWFAFSTYQCNTSPVHYVRYEPDILDIFFEYSFKIPQIYSNIFLSGGREGLSAKTGGRAIQASGRSNNPGTTQASNQLLNQRWYHIWSGPTIEAFFRGQDLSDSPVFLPVHHLEHTFLLGPISFSLVGKVSMPPLGTFLIRNMYPLSLPCIMASKFWWGVGLIYNHLAVLNPINFGKLKHNHGPSHSSWAICH
jgi:hypothetical protein